MRRVEELIDEVRRNTENELPTAGDVTLGGITDESIIHLFNRAQQRLYSRYLTKYPGSFIATTTIDITSGTEAYTLGTDDFNHHAIIMVEYLTDSTSTYYHRIPPATFHERYTNVNGTPQYYIVQNKTILLNPIPNETKTAGIRVTYYRRPLNLDKRSGYVASASKTGTTLNTLTLDDPSGLLDKDADLDVAANAVLTEADYICLVDKDGTTILNNIPIDDYNTTTRVITVSAGFTTDLAASALDDYYVVQGKTATTHHEFPLTMERYLILYAEAAILRRDGNEREANLALQELSFIEQDMLASSAMDFDVFERPLDEHWINEF